MSFHKLEYSHNSFKIYLQVLSVDCIEQERGKKGKTDSKKDVSKSKHYYIVSLITKIFYLTLRKHTYVLETS